MKKNKLLVVVCGVMIMFTLNSILPFITAEANNHGDTQFLHYYNGDGGDRYTVPRSKTDYTSSYSFNNKSTYGYSTNVYGNFGGSNIGAYCTATPQHVSVGQAKYLPNYVKERGYSHARIGMMSDSHARSTINMLWSPDSI